MRDLLALVGALCVGSTFLLILLVILGTLQERDDRRARDRQQENREAVEHIRRFSAVMNVLDMEEHRRRKANAPAAESGPQREALLPVVSTGGGAEFITSMGAPRNA